MFLIITGNRPQLTKLAPLVREATVTNLKFKTCYTDQHYSAELKSNITSELGLDFDFVLERNCRDKYSSEFSRVFDGLMKLLDKERFDAIVGLGDTNTTVAAGLAAHWKNLPFIHIEGGERLYNRDNVPEEFNRILADNCAALTICASRKSYQNLINEGFDESRAVFCGDLMYDNYKMLSYENEAQSDTDGEDSNFIVCTIHRAENTDNIQRFTLLIQQLIDAPILVKLFAHPRIHAMLNDLDIKLGERVGNLICLPAVTPKRLLRELESCQYVITDSGGLSREAMFAKKYCYTLMPSTWWPEAIELGLGKAIDTNLDNLPEKIDCPNVNDENIEWHFGNGSAAKEIVAQLHTYKLNLSDVKWAKYCDFSSLPKFVDRTEFTYDYYIKFILDIISQGYESCNPGNFKINGSKQLFLRHDIDFCVEAALRFAEVERQHGISSNYYFMLNTEHYNLLAKSNRDRLTRISELGHTIGLHFDCAGFDDHTEIDSAIKSEASILSDLLGKSVDTISFHRPNEDIVLNTFKPSGQFLNCYDKSAFKNFEYISDSSGFWNYGSPTERISQSGHNNIQLLTHPIWWGNAPRTPHYNLTNLLYDKMAIQAISFRDNCRSFMYS